MKSKKLIAAAVAAITMLVGGLGTALWPSSAGATGSIRKFTGPLRQANSFTLYVRIHNPHATTTFKPSVVVRNAAGAVASNQELTVTPNEIDVATAVCNSLCSLEVNMTSALLQPTVEYFHIANNRIEFVYSGDFSR